MRIVILSYRYLPYVGGIEVNSEILAQAFSERGHEVRVLTTTKDKLTHETLLNYTIIRDPSFFTLVKNYFWATHILENNPALSLSWPLIFFPFKKHTIAICTWIQRMNGKKSVLDYLKITWLWYASNTIAVSNAIKNKTIRKAIVIGNPYRENIFNEIISTNSKEYNLVFLGRLVSDKGCDLLIDAMAVLIEKYKLPLNLTIIGDGNEKEYLQSKVMSLKLSNVVKFKGLLRGVELVATLNQHELMVVPSIWEEPFGNVVLEGLACGCIPIASDGGGLPDAVGDTGLLFKRNNLEDLIQVILYFYNTPSLKQELKSKAKNHLSLFTTESIINKYLNTLSK